jgi:hypothetical protein
LYYESQGIVDIAVKLYAMAQIRAIGLQTEAITSNDFRAVVAEKFGLVKPALDALRSGDKKRIKAIGDIAPIGIEDYYEAYLAMLPPETEKIPKKRDGISLSEQAILKLLELDVEPVAAKRLVGKVMAAHMELRKVGDIVKMAYQAYALHEEQSEERLKTENDKDGDIRNASGYNDMKATGTVKNVEW